MKNLLLTFCFAYLLLLSGCRPDGVLSESEMTDLLSDLYLTDGFIEAAGDARQVWDSLDVYGPRLEEFNASMEYYLRHPKEFADIFEKIQDKLEAEGKLIDDRDLEEEEEVEEAPEESLETVWEDIDENPVKVEKAEKAEKPEKETKRKKGRKKLSKKELEELEKQLEK